jgi:membrane-bound serine protease (ClpP class)
MDAAPWTDIPPILLLFGAAAVTAALVMIVKLVVGIAQWARPSPHRIGGRWGIETVEVVDWKGDSGHVLAGGELWRALGPTGLAPGDRVFVKKTEGLTLLVRRG